MRHIPSVTLAALAILLTAPAVAGENTGQSLRDASNASDAELLAERHLALYRAALLPATSDGTARGSNAAATPPAVRTSATAALPLATERQTSR